MASPSAGAAGFSDASTDATVSDASTDAAACDVLRGLVGHLKRMSANRSRAAERAPRHVELRFSQDSEGNSPQKTLESELQAALEDEMTSMLNELLKVNGGTGVHQARSRERARLVAEMFELRNQQAYAEGDCSEARSAARAAAEAAAAREGQLQAAQREAESLRGRLSDLVWLQGHGRGALENARLRYGAQEEAQEARLHRRRLERAEEELEARAEEIDEEAQEAREQRWRFARAEGEVRALASEAETLQGQIQENQGAGCQAELQETQRAHLLDLRASREESEVKAWALEAQVLHGRLEEAQEARWEAELVIARRRSPARAPRALQARASASGATAARPPSPDGAAWAELAELREQALELRAELQAAEAGSPSSLSAPSASRRRSPPRGSGRAPEPPRASDPGRATGNAAAGFRPGPLPGRLQVLQGRASKVVATEDELLENPKPNAPRPTCNAPEDPRLEFRPVEARPPPASPRQLARSLHVAAVSSFFATRSLSEHADSLEALFEAQRAPSAEALEATWCFARELEAANAWWAQARQRCGDTEGGCVPQVACEDGGRTGACDGLSSGHLGSRGASWFPIIAEARDAELQARGLAAHVLELLERGGDGR